MFGFAEAIVALLEDEVQLVAELSRRLVWAGVGRLIESAACASVLTVLSVCSPLGRGALLLAESEQCGVLQTSLLVVLGALARIGFLLISLGLPLGSSRAAGFLSGWVVGGLASLGHLDCCGFVLLELRVLLGRPPVLLASRDAHVLMDGGAGLAAVQGRVHLGRSSSGEGDGRCLGFFLGDFDCMGCKIRYHVDVSLFLI